MSEKQPFVVMVKPVGSRCNMNCRYCYYLKKGMYSSHETQTVLTTELLEKMIRETVAAAGSSTVSFVWHGGEPTLAGIPFFRKALQLERRYLKEGQTAWNNLQTNGLLIDDEWASFLSRHRFDVGLSIDGTEAVHNANRPDLGNRGTWEKSVRAVKTLKKYGLRPDLLCTVNAETVKDPLGVYRAPRDLETGWMQFIPILVKKDGPEAGSKEPSEKTGPYIPNAGSEESSERPEGTDLYFTEAEHDRYLTAESVTPSQYGDFLCQVFDEWITHDLGKCDVQFFAEIAHVLAGQEPALCWMSKTCGRVVIAEEDGSVYACDHFVDPEHRLGNFGDSDMSDLANLQVQLDFGNSKETALTKECRNCPYLSYCNGACLKDRFGLSKDGEKGQYYLCPGLQKFFAHAIGPMKKVMAWTKEGMPLPEVMKRAEKLIR